MRGLSVIVLLLLASSGSATAQDAGDQGQLLSEQNDLIVVLLGRLERMERRVEQLEAQLEPGPANVGPGATSMADETGPDLVAATGEDVQSLVTEITEKKRREQEQLVRAALQRTLIDRGGLLLPSGTIDIQPSLSYLHSSAENIVIDGFTILPVLVIGDIVSERVERDLTQLATTFRFGLPWDSQIEMRLPYNRYSTRSFSADNVETTRSASGWGDIELGLSHQFYRSTGLWPDLLASLRWKTTSGEGPFDIDPDRAVATGTGFDSINLAVTAVKVVDPAVYFGSLNHSWNLSRNESIGKYDPGNSYGFSLGMAIALNLSNSLSFGYDQQSVQHSSVDGMRVPGSYLTTGLFTVGTSFAANDFLTADLSLGFGVTADSPDFQIDLSVPIRSRH
ncbi:MAG: hypothetical protein WBN65_01430 [Gammaproteobacteria bacterium]